MSSYIKSLCLALLLAGITANAMDEKQRAQLNTELILAAEMGDYNAVDDSLNRGADVNYVKPIDYKNIDGNTALIIAAQKGYGEIVKLLTASGANVDYTNKFAGDTALIEAADKGHYPIVKWLVDWGAKTTKKNKYGSTAFAKATYMQGTYITPPFHNISKDDYIAICSYLAEQMLTTSIPSTSQCKRLFTFFWCLKKKGHSFANFYNTKDLRIALAQEVIMQEKREYPEESFTCEQINAISDKYVDSLELKQHLLETFSMPEKKNSFCVIQ